MYRFFGPIIAGHLRTSQNTVYTKNSYKSEAYIRYSGGIRGVLGGVLSDVGRCGRIRTSDPFVPNEVRYQAALHTEIEGAKNYTKK